MARQYAVFVSSTHLDNPERRATVIDAIQRAGMRAVGMEWFTAAARPTVEECRREVGACDVLVGILGYRLGWVPPDERRSITEIEYDAASQRLMFLLRGAVDPERDFDQGEERWDKQKKLEAFKARVQLDQKAARFTDQDLGVVLLQALLEWRKEFEQGLGSRPKRARSARRTRAADEGEVRDYAQRLARLNDSVRVVGFGERVRNPLRLEDLQIELALTPDQRRGVASESRAAAEAESRLGAGHTLKLSDAFRCAEERGGRRGLVLLGDPGSGKSTTLKRLVLQLAQPEGARALGLAEGTAPVLVPLRNLASASAAGRNALVAACIERAELGLEKGFAKRLLARGRLLFLLDGLDEVPSGEERATVARWIESLLRRRQDCRCVVTCRYAGYRNEAQLGERFLELHLRPLTPEQSVEFVCRWFETVERSQTLDAGQADVFAAERATSLLARLKEPEFRSARVAELRRNPLLLSSICLVHRDRGELPQPRARLYHECVHVLLERGRDEERGPVSIEAEAALRFLQPMAFFLHKEQGRTKASAGTLTRVLKAGSRASDKRLPTPRDFLRAVRDESGLLAGWSGEIYGFGHLGFQEYLAAGDIHARGYGNAAALRTLARHFGEDWWQEVILFVLALGERAVFEGLMKAILARPNVLQHEALLRLCLRDAAETSPRPFVSVLRSKANDARATRKKQLALRLLREVDPAQASKFDPEPSRVELARKRFRNVERANLRLVRIPGGTFWMGAADGELGASSRERPRHEATLPAFELAVTPVTNAQYERFLEDSPRAKEPAHWGDRAFNQAHQPVVGVSWEEAKAYCAWAGLRLPSEAEWEYACRAGTTTRYWSGDSQQELAAVGWFADNSGGSLHPVGEKPANALGLHDTHGNVWEWCEDSFHGDYQSAPTDGNAWLDQASRFHVIRGGSFVDSSERGRSAARDRDIPSFRWPFTGFRPARSITTD